MADALQASAARIDVTPERPVPLAGYAGRNQVYQGIHDTLELNALRLSGFGQDVVILTLDGLSFSQELEDHCRSRLPKGTPVFGVASHTHYAPALDGHLPQLAPVDAQYRAFVFAQAEALIDDLMSRPLMPARLAWGEAGAHHAVNRRRRAWKPSRRGLHREICLLPNPVGPCDQTLRTLVIEGADGAPLACLWSYACHAVSFYDDMQVSADYPGIVRQHIRARLGADTPCLFWPGFSGNIRPDIIAPLNTPKSWLRWLLQGSFFGQFTKASWQRWADSLAAIAIAALDDAAPLAATHLTVTDTPVPYAQLQDATPDGRPVPRVATVTLGDDLSLVMLSGEPVLEMRDVLTGLTQTRHTLHTGYRGHLFGYWPTAKIVSEGGYEADGFRQAFALPGRYDADIDTRLRAFLKLR